jgi:hypothetical protein
MRGRWGCTPDGIGPIAQGGVAGKREVRAYLVWILHQHIFSLRMFHTQIDNRPYDAPAVGERDIQLTGEVQRPVRCGTEDNVACVITRVRAGNVPVRMVSERSFGQRPG